MKHKIHMLSKLMDMMHQRSASRIKGLKKPAVSIEIHKHEEGMPDEEHLLSEKMEEPMDELRDSDDEELVAEGKHLRHKFGR